MLMSQNKLRALSKRAKDATWLLDETQRTDNALASRFIDTIGMDLKFVTDWQVWLVWDGCRFKLDKGGTHVLKLARKFAKQLWRDCHAIAEDNSVPNNVASVARKFVHAANKREGIKAFIELAKADHRVMILHDDLNANGDLLNVSNGTVDLSTGELREHQRSDLLTQIANTSYGETAGCPRWENAIDLIFAGDGELIRYVQQVLGYSLVGSGGEHILPIAYGSGCNGKSFVWNTIVELAGEYGCVANDTLLLGDKNAHATEKANLYQRRIVAVSEPEQGVAMKESRVKELTGDSFVTARRMKEDFWTFRRTHTFWLATNHLPRVSGTDDGIWRRLKVIPFNVDLREKTAPIPNYHRVVLEAEGPGILNWLIAGYADYQKHGFVEPDAVRRLCQSYRQGEDHIEQFLRECCIIAPSHSAQAKELFTAYRTWGGLLSNTAFGVRITERFEKTKTSKGAQRNCIFYHGVGLATDKLEKVAEGLPVCS
jgi:P4 family phage/plasmid primase-like protien